jgi:hypothetical protein
MPAQDTAAEPIDAARQSFNDRRLGIDEMTEGLSA